MIVYIKPRKKLKDISEHAQCMRGSTNELGSWGRSQKQLRRGGVVVRGGGSAGGRARRLMPDAMSISHACLGGFSSPGCTFHSPVDTFPCQDMLGGGGPRGVCARRPAATHGPFASPACRLTCRRWARQRPGTSRRRASWRHRSGLVFACPTRRWTLGWTPRRSRRRRAVRGLSLIHI